VPSPGAGFCGLWQHRFFADSETHRARPGAMQETGNPKAFLDFGSFVSAIVYFISFMALIYFFVVVPYRFIQVFTSSLLCPTGSSKPAAA
jgi:large-conductance mechanosensitive channel